MTSVGDWMSREIVAITPRTRVRDAQALMERHSISHLLVADEGHLLGVLCACDLDDAPQESAVARYMARPPLTVIERTPLENVAALLEEAHIGCLPVVARGRVVGIVTHTDLRRAGAIDPIPAACSACGARHHVRPDPRGTGVLYCPDCAAGTPAIEGYDDLGDGD